MREAERLLRAAGCPKINLQIRTSNTGVIEFYKAIGYDIDDVVSMGNGLNMIALIRANKPMSRTAGNYRAIGFFVSLFAR